MNVYKHIHSIEIGMYRQSVTYWWALSIVHPDTGDVLVDSMIGVYECGDEQRYISGSGAPATDCPIATAMLQHHLVVTDYWRQIANQMRWSGQFLRESLSAERGQR